MTMRVSFAFKMPKDKQMWIEIHVNDYPGQFLSFYDSFDNEILMKITF